MSETDTPKYSLGRGKIEWCPIRRGSPPASQQGGGPFFMPSFSDRFNVIQKQDLMCDCLESVKKICNLIQPDGIYICTRPKGHPGSHVACGGYMNHRLTIWKQKEQVHNETY